MGMGTRKKRKDRCFTLIELLIVVAIIAILAAIALPNFLEAQVRAKVARVKSDFRTLQTAMESYAVDYNCYPPDTLGTSWVRDYLVFINLTTPIAYLSSVPADSPFDRDVSDGRGNYAYWGNAATLSAGLQVFYHIISSGPDRDSDLGGTNLIPEAVVRGVPPFLDALYDPTNGTISSGDLHVSNRGLSN